VVIECWGGVVVVEYSFVVGVPLLFPHSLKGELVQEGSSSAQAGLADHAFIYLLLYV